MKLPPGKGRRQNWGRIIQPSILKNGENYRLFQNIHQQKGKQARDSDISLTPSSQH